MTQSHDLPQRRRKAFPPCGRALPLRARQTAPPAGTVPVAGWTSGVSSRYTLCSGHTQRGRGLIQHADFLKQVGWDSHALFLDFDGTLAPIVARPEDAAIAPATAGALVRLTALTGGALAILSGRDLADLDARLRVPGLAAAGSHGMELRDAAGHMRMLGSGDGELDAAAAELAGFARKHDLILERKKGAATIHYRSRPDLGDAAQDLVERLAAGHDGLRPMHGHMVSEVVLAGIGKGNAVRAFLEVPPFRGRIPVAVGDDTTDEDAFAAAQDAGGFGVRIGPGATCAHHRLPEIGAFLDWLHHAE